jgi:hypothetical protein
LIKCASLAKRRSKNNNLRLLQSKEEVAYVDAEKGFSSFSAKGLMHCCKLLHTPVFAAASSTMDGGL